MGWLGRPYGASRKKREIFPLALLIQGPGAQQYQGACLKYACSGPTQTSKIRLRVRSDHRYINKLPDSLYLGHEKSCHV